MVALLLFVVSLPFLLLLAWQIQPARLGLKNIGLSIASQFLDGTLEVEDLGGNLISSLEVKNARWYRKGKSKDLMAGLDFLRVRYDLWHFLSTGELLVLEVYLKRPRGYLAMDAKGTLDLLKHIKSSPPSPKKPEPKPKPKESGTGPSFRLRVDSVKIVDLEGSFRLGPKANPMSVTGFSLDTDYSLNLQGFQMKSEIKKLVLGACLNRPTFLACHKQGAEIQIQPLRLGFWMKGQDLGANDFHLRLGKQSEIKMNVVLNLLKILQFKLDLKRLFVHPEDIKGLVPAYPVKTPVIASLQAHGTLADLMAKLQAQVGKAHIDLQANSDILRQSYDLNLGIRNADLQELLGNPALHSDLSLSVVAKGQGFSAKTNGSVLVEIQPGHLQKKYTFKKIRVDALAKDGIATLKQFRIQTSFAQIAGRAHVAYLIGDIDAFVAATIPQLQPLGALVGQKMRGRLKLQAWAKGKQWLPKANAKIEIAKFIYWTQASPRQRGLFRQYTALFRRYQTQWKQILAQQSTKTPKQGRRTRRTIFVDGRCRSLYLQQRRRSQRQCMGVWSPSSNQPPIPAEMLGYCTQHFQSLAASHRISTDPVARVEQLTVEAQLLDMTPLRARVDIRGRHIRAGGQWVRRFQLATSARMDFAKKDIQAQLSRFSYDIGTGLFRLERQTSLQVRDFSKIRVRNLWWRHASERIRLDAYIDTQRWLQDVRLHIQHLRLTPLQKALGIMRGQHLSGELSVDVQARGSFARPRLLVQVDLSRMEFQQFRGFFSTLRIGYQWDKQPKQQLSLDFSASHRSQGGTLKKLAGLEVRLPLLLNLQRVALQSNLCGLIPTQKDIRVALSVPGLDLDWLGKQLNLPQLKGFLASDVVLEQTLASPRLRTTVQLKKAGWARYRSFDAHLFVNYHKDSLIFSRQIQGTTKTEPTTIHLNGRRLLMMGGQLPVFFAVKQHKGMLAPRYGLVDRMMNFSAYFDRQSLGWLLEQLVPSLPPQIAYLDGIFDGFLSLRGQPSRPIVDLKVDLQEGSFCPLTQTGFSCFEQVGFDDRGEYQFKQKDDITKTVRKNRGLRVKGLTFSLDFHYVPPTSGNLAGRALLNAKLGVGEQTLLALGRHAQPKRNCKFGDEAGDLAPKPVELAINLSMNPKTFQVRYNLLDPIRFPLQVPKLRLQTLSRWVKLDIMKKLRGEFLLDFSVCQRLSNPDLKLQVRLNHGAYEAGEDLDGKPRYLDRINFVLDADLREGNVGWFMQTKVLGKELLQNTTFLRGIHVGIDSKTFQMIRKKMGNYIYSHIRIPGFDLQELAERIGMKDKLYGVISGNFEVAGDPACPLLGQPTKGSLVRNHLTIENGYAGIPRALYLQLRKNKIPSEQIAALRFRRFRIAVHSMQDGRFHLQLGIWQNSDPDARPPDMIVGDVRWPLPLRVFPLSPSELVQQKRCSHWANGRPDPKIKVLVSRNTYPLSLRFIEAFVPGLLFDVVVDATIQAEGTVDKIKSAEGSINVHIRRIAMEQYGVNIFTNLDDPDMRKKQYQLYRQCQLQIRNNLNRNKQTKVLDLYIPGCIYSYLRVALDDQAYRLEGRLQGAQGKPMVIYGSIPRDKFALDLSPASACTRRDSPDYDSEKCRQDRETQSRKKIALFVRSDDFQPMATPRHKMELFTHIDIVKVWNTPLKILGTIRIPDLLFTLPESSRSAKNYNDHADMVVLGEKTELKLRPQPQALQKKKAPAKATPAKATPAKAQQAPRIVRRKKPEPGMIADLKIVIPRGIRVRNRDLDFTARTEEFRDLQVKLAGDILTLVGGVEVVRGEITFYTKKFTVQSGSRVTFMGQSLSFDELGQLNARLQISAKHTITMPKNSSLAKRGHGRVNVMLLVSGTIQDPNVDLEVRDASSDQRIAMDQANVLTLIMTGSTTEDLAGGQQSGLSDQALGAFSKMASAQLRDKLSEVVPIDVLKFETGARPEDIKIEIGKYITQWLYLQLLSKPVPLEEEDMWEILVDVAITRRWSLETRFGQRRRNNALLFRGSTHFFFRLKR